MFIRLLFQIVRKTGTEFQQAYNKRIPTGQLEIFFLRKRLAEV